MFRSHPSCQALFALLLSLPLVLGAQKAPTELYEPLLLQPQRTVIDLAELLPNRTLDSLELPAGLKDVCPDQDQLCLEGKPLQKLSLLKLYGSGGAQVLPLVASSQQRVEISFPANAFPDAQNVQVSGITTGHRESAPLIEKNGLYQKHWYLSPGTYTYHLLVDGEAMPDPTNRNQVRSSDGQIINRLEVQPPGKQPGPFQLAWQGNRGVIQLQDVHTKLTVLWENQALKLACTKSMKPQCSFELPAEARQRERSHLRIYSYSQHQLGRDQLIPLEKGTPLHSVDQLNTHDQRQNRLYALAGKASSSPVGPEKSNLLLGDTLASLLEAVRRGYFQKLGFNVLCLPTGQPKKPEDSVQLKALRQAAGDQALGLWHSHAKPLLLDSTLLLAAEQAFRGQADLYYLKDALEKHLLKYGYHNICGHLGTFPLVQNQGSGHESPAEHTDYQRFALLEAFYYSIPGLPGLLAGHEYGPGFDQEEPFYPWQVSKVNLLQQALIEKIQALNAARSKHLPLIYGNTEMEVLGREIFLLRRRYLDQEIVILFNLSSRALVLNVPGGQSYQPLDDERERVDLSALVGPEGAVEKSTGHRVASRSYLMLQRK